MNVDEKLVIARQLERLGVDVIEAGFPISSQGDFDSVRVIAENITGPTICGLARARDDDIDAAGRALEPCRNKRVHVFIATSQLHMDKKLKMSQEQVIEAAVRGVRRARNYTDDVEFSPEDCSRTDIQFMCQIIEAAIDAGATTINIPDTVGYAIPQEIGERITHVRQAVPNIDKVTLSIHCHNDLGLAVANSMAAVEAGCDQVECTINGIGERAGNASLEEVVMALRLRSDAVGADTDVNTKEIWSTSRLVSSLTGLDVQRNKAIVGENAFAHEAGIHQHGVIADRRTYEILRAEDVGWNGQQLVIGKHSGVHAVEEVLKSRGFALDQAQLREVVARVKNAADKDKRVEDEDVLAFASEVLDDQSTDKPIVELRELSVMTGNSFTASATIKLTINDHETIGTGTGVGPVDAAAHALASILRTNLGSKLRLQEYGLKAITGGTDALAHAHIRLSDDKGGSFRGEAIDGDVILASVYAMVKGANRALNAHRKATSPGASAT